MKKILALLCLLFACSHLPVAHAQTTIFVSRHADRFGTEPDPDLTPKGYEQAQALARMLVDANIKHIFTTELIRTQKTAEPTARQAAVTPVVVPQDKFDDLIMQVKQAIRPNESMLIVGHRESVSRIVHALSGKDIVPLTGDEYGRLLMITLMPDGSSTVVTLRYAPKKP